MTLAEYEGKTVMVTGAGGFIGSHLVELLVAVNAHVRAFVRYNSRADIGLLADIDAETRHRTEIVFGDLRDADAVLDAAQGVDVVLHLGAFIAIPYSYLHPREVIDTNVGGTLNVLMAARRHKVERTVHASTSEVYGTAQSVPMSETHRINAQSPYAASKAAADQIVSSFHLSYGLPVTTLRPFNTYGPRQSPRAVIPAITMQCLSGVDSIRLGALDPTRDFTFVADTALAFALAGIADGVDGETINAGSGHEISIGDLAALIQEVVGTRIPIVADPRRIRPPTSEVERLVSDATRARELLGWEPAVDLRQGLERTAAWFGSRTDRLRPDRYYV